MGFCAKDPGNGFLHAVSNPFGYVVALGPCAVFWWRGCAMYQAPAKVKPHSLEDGRQVLEPTSLVLDFVG